MWYSADRQFRQQVWSAGCRRQIAEVDALGRAAKIEPGSTFRGRHDDDAARGRGAAVR